MCSSDLNRRRRHAQREHGQVVGIKQRDNHDSPEVINNRRAIHNVKIEKTVIVTSGGEETLTAVSALLAQCSKVGGNLNQLARHFNSSGADTEQLRARILDELADLTAFRFHAEKVLGELYGNAQAYRL